MKSPRLVVLSAVTSMAGHRARSLARWVVLVPASLLLSSLLLVAVVPLAAPVSASCGSGCGSAGDWTMFHNGPTHAGYNSAETTLTTSNVPFMTSAWTGATTIAGVYSSPAVANGVVYVGSRDDKLYAFAVGCASGGGTCTPIWTGATGGGIDSSPAVANGVVYVGSNDHKLYAFAVGCASGGGTCTPLWTAATGFSIWSSPTVVGGVVYVGSQDASLYAFDAAGVTRCSGTAPNRTCLPLWTGPTGNSIDNSSPAVSGGVVYIASQDGKLYAFGVGCNFGGGTCTPIWTGATGGSITTSSPAVAGGVVYVGSNDDKLYAFAVGCATGNNPCTPIWTGATAGSIDSSPAVANGVVYVGSLDGKLYAYAVGCATGNNPCTPIWTGDTTTGITSSPAVANGVVYIGAGNNKLYAFAVGCATGNNPCSSIWTGTATGAFSSSPTVANGVVYAGATDGKLNAFDLHVDHLVLSPSNTTITAGSSQPYAAEAFDVLNHDLGDFTGATSFTYDTSTVCSANSCSPVVAGVHTVTGTDGTATGTATLHVNAGALNHLALSPSSATIASGGSQAYTASGADLYNNNLGDVTGATTITIDLGTACPAHVCTSAVVGDHTVTGTDGATHGTATLHVRVGATYHPLTPPARLLDTRIGEGLSGKLLANTPATFQVAGVGGSGIPSNASAVTGNVTVVNSSFSWAVYLGPDPVASPSTSTVNFNAGEVAGNGLTVALSGTGSLSATYISNAGNTTDLVFDVTGYFTPDMSGDTFHAMSPARLLDTRNGTGLGGKLLANTPATFNVAGSLGVPPDARAVTGNVTVVSPTNSWAVFLGPVPDAAPGTSTINFNAGQVKGNSLTVALGAGGTLSATYMSTAGNTTDLVFDVTGYYTADGSGATFVPMAPARLLDTRVGNGLGGRLLANTPATFNVGGRDVIPVGAAAVTGNVTVVGETNSWAVFLGPDPTPSPGTSTVNFSTGEVKGNGLTVALGGGGTLSATYISTSGNTTDLVFDVTGYFVP